ncbi:MAG: glycosyl transferase [Bacteroidota bacterium]
MSFPFDSAQEANFIVPELARWKRDYKKIIFVPAQVKGSQCYPMDDQLSMDTTLAGDFEKRYSWLNFLSWRWLFNWISICFHIANTQEKLNWKLYSNAFFFGLRMQISLCYLKRLKGEIDLYSFWNTYITASMAQLKGFKGRRWTRVHGDDLYPERQGGIIPFETQTYSNLDEVVFASKAALSFYLQRHPGIHTPTSIAYIGVSFSNLIGNVAVMPKRQPLVLVTCSGLNPVKQLALVNGWINRWNKSHGQVQLEWHHLGATTAALSEHIQESTVAIGHGWMSQFEVMQWYQTMQPFALFSLSRSEGGFPVSMQEALICGIPLIGSANGGVIEALEISEGFTLSSTPDFEEFKKTMEEIISLPDSEILRLRQKAMDVGRTLFLR